MNKKILIALPVLLMATTVLACNGHQQCQTNVVLGSVNLEKISTFEAYWYGWSKLQPATSGGTWGGVSDKNYWRTVSSVGDKYGDTAYEYIFSKNDMKKLEIEHLDGIADDSFDVYIADYSGMNWIKIGHYADQWNDGTEHIMTTDFSIPWRVNYWISVKIVLTGAHWSQYNTYGQLAIHSITAIGDICNKDDRR